MAMRIRLILEEGLLEKGDFRSLCDGSGEPRCCHYVCPRVCHAPEGGLIEKFSDFVEHLRTLGYSGKSMASMAIGVPESAKADYRLYFVRDGEDFHIRGAAVLDKDWCLLATRPPITSMP